MSQRDQARQTFLATGAAYNLATVRERMDMIAATDWATDLDWGEIVRVAQFFDACSIEPGEVVFHEGDLQAYMCLVVDGVVEVRKRDQHGNDAVITTIDRGKSFGEMSLIDGEPRSATVVAAGRTSLLVLTHESFARLTEESPRLVLRMVLRLARSVTQRLRQASGVLVEHLGE